MLCLKTNLAVLAFACCLLGGIPAEAASPTDIINAINADHFLDPSARLNVRIDGTQVHVSTYRQPLQSEQDSKIDAVLIAKSVFSVTGDAASRVNVYFYGKELSQYQEVQVTAGDVKAFASGEVPKDQLLSSLVVQTKNVQDERDKIVGRLENAAFARPSYRVSVPSGDRVVISTALGAWVQDDEAKIEALKIANTAVAAVPAGTRNIVISFVDARGKSDTREISFPVSQVESMWRAVRSSLDPIQLAHLPAVIDLQDLQATNGVLKAERQALLDRLKGLEKKGIGVAPFVKAFTSIEEQVPRADEAALKQAIERLSLSLDDQEKASKSAKEARTKPTTTPTKIDTTATMTRSRWALGDQPIIESEVLADPQRVVQRMEADYARGFMSAEQNPKFLIVLDEVSKILRHHARAAEAARYEQRAQVMRSRGIR